MTVPTLRHHGKLFHIGIGRTLADTTIILLVHDLDIRVIHAATGEIIRTLTLNPDRQLEIPLDRGGILKAEMPCQKYVEGSIRTSVREPLGSWKRLGNRSLS